MIKTNHLITIGGLTLAIALTACGGKDGAPTGVTAYDAKLTADQKQSLIAVTKSGSDVESVISTIENNQKAAEHRLPNQDLSPAAQHILAAIDLANCVIKQIEPEEFKGDQDFTQNSSFSISGEKCALAYSKTNTTVYKKDNTYVSKETQGYTIQSKALKALVDVDTSQNTQTEVSSSMNDENAVKFTKTFTNVGSVHSQKFGAIGVASSSSYDVIRATNASTMISSAKFNFPTFGAELKIKEISILGQDGSDKTEASLNSEVLTAADLKSMGFGP